MNKIFKNGIFGLRTYLIFSLFFEKFSKLYGNEKISFMFGMANLERPKRFINVNIFIYHG